MDQHFVPVCYLSGFTDPVVPPGHHPAVWVRRRGTSGWRQRAPRNVASAAEFYSATDRDGRCRRDVECVWTAIEDAVAPLLKKMAIVPFSLTSKEREHLALFVAAQFIRVPAQIEHLQGFLAQVQMKFLELHYGWFRSDPGAMRRHMARFAEETGATLPENLTVEHFNPEHWRVEVPKAAALQVMLPSLLETAARIARMGWTFYLASGPNVFITSDNPYCMVNPEAPVHGSGLARQHIEVSLPLHPRVALVARHREPKEEWARATPALVHAINARTVLGAKEYLFASRRDFPGAHELVQMLDRARDEVEAA